MSKDKCGNCAHFENEQIDGFGFCVVFNCIHHCTGGGKCIAYQLKNNGWTEISPDNVEEIKSIEGNRVIICASNSIGYMYPSTLLNLACSLESIADYGGYYYYVLPELKIE